MELKKQEIGFTQVSNTILRDNSVSLKAKGMYAILYSKPDGWDFSSERLKKESEDGEHSTLTALKELEEKGYLVRKKLTNGRVEYHLMAQQSLSAKIPIRENPNQGKSQSGKIADISNTESIVINNTSNKENGAEAPKASKERREDIDILLNGIKEIVKMIDGSKFEQRNFAKNFLDSKTPEILRQSGNMNPTKQQIINATLRLFQLAKNDNFHQKHCTNMKYVYNKAGSIVMTSASNKPKIAIIS